MQVVAPKLWEVEIENFWKNYITGREKFFSQELTDLPVLWFRNWDQICSFTEPHDQSKLYKPKITSATIFSYALGSSALEVVLGLFPFKFVVQKKNKTH